VLVCKNILLFSHIQHYSIGIRILIEVIRHARTLNRNTYTRTKFPQNGHTDIATHMRFGNICTIDKIMTPILKFEPTSCHFGTWNYFNDLRMSKDVNIERKIIQMAPFFRILCILVIWTPINHNNGSHLKLVRLLEAIWDPECCYNELCMSKSLVIRPNGYPHGPILMTLLNFW